MAVHELKILPEYYRAIMFEGKSFELRKDDRGFQVGDTLRLMEITVDDAGELLDYTGKSIYAEINYILRDAPQFGLCEGYAILGLWRIREVRRRSG